MSFRPPVTPQFPFSFIRELRFTAPDESVRLVAAEKSPHAFYESGTEPQVPPGHGVVDIRIGCRWGWANRASLTQRTRNSASRWLTRSRDLRPVSRRRWIELRRASQNLPTAPLLLVNGEPVASGFGTGKLVLPAGQHVLSLQAGSSGPYRVVNVTAGETVELDAFTTIFRSPEALVGRPNHEYRDADIAPRGKHLVREHRRRQLLPWLLVPIIVLGLVNSAVMSMGDVGDASTGVPAYMWAPLVLIIALLITPILFVLHRRRKTIAARQEPFTLLASDSSAGASHLLDYRDKGIENAPNDESRVVVNLVYREDKPGHAPQASAGELGQVAKDILSGSASQAQRYGGAAQDLFNIRRQTWWLPTPQVRVANQVMPVEWGKTSLRVPSGKQWVVVSSPIPPDQFIDNDSTTIAHSGDKQVEVVAQPGKTIHVNVVIDTKHVFDSGHKTLESFESTMRTYLDKE